MNDNSFAFLRRLLDAPGPSGFETPAARVWRDEMEQVADRTRVDVQGNSIATISPGGRPRVMLAGHIDEIGLMVLHVTDEGMLYIDGIGGWDSQVLVGQRVRVLGRDGERVGVIGKKPIHLMKEEERSKVSKLDDLWIDLGAESRDDVASMGIRVGDPAVIDADFRELSNGRIVSRAIDNRIGAYVVAEALRLLREGDGSGAEVSAVATTQEEIGYHGGGARTSAFQIEPDVALVVDVTFASDAPGIEKNVVGDHRLGGGPVLSRGSALHPLVFERLAEVAEREGIAVSLQGQARSSHTDADAIYLTRAGVPTGLISIPNRYMHSPNEMVATADLDSAARLIAAFCRDLGESTDFTPR